MSKLSKPPRQSVSESRPFERLSRMHYHAAGVDIGAHEIVVCVPGPNDTQIVRTFANYTADLYQLADWLSEYGIQMVAMESTGVYWIPLFETLEAREFKCALISATAIKRFPGRKSDVLDCPVSQGCALRRATRATQDCQWIQTLHSYGLLADSFRPEADLIALRTLLRHRAQLIQHRSPHILHMQKALLQMNLQLSQVLSDITGETAQRILRAIVLCDARCTRVTPALRVWHRIVAGERDPHKLAALRNYRCQKDRAEIAKALTGTWREEHLFVLTQSLALFDFYTAQIQLCDEAIERTYSLIRPNWGELDAEALPARKPHSHSKNAPQAVQVRAHLKRISGVDLVAVHGISVSLAPIIIAEIGTDMSRFPTDKDFCSWLGLAPHNDISGGKVLRSRTLKTHNRAGQAFRQAAAAVMRANCAFGAFYRRLKSRLGPAQAVVATAHKIARVVYHMLKCKVEYQAVSTEEYEQRFREREIRYLERKAVRLGFVLSPSTDSVPTVS